MAYVEPTDRAKGDFITAAIWNINTDNLLDTHDVIISGALVTKSGNQAANSGDDVTWQTETLDQGGYFDAGAPTKLTAPAAGMYLVTAYAVSSGATAFSLNVDGTSRIVYGSPTILIASSIIALTAAQYITLRVGTDAVTISAGYLAIKQLAKW
jgi:hypothetical protein